MREEILCLSTENDAFKSDKKEKRFVADYSQACPSSKMQLLSGASKYMNRAASSVGASPSGGEGCQPQSAMIAYLGDALEETKTALRVSEADRWRANGHSMKEMIAQLR